MRTVQWILLSAVCVVLLPAAASGQTGSCLAAIDDDGLSAAACVDGLTQQDCTILDGSWDSDTCAQRGSWDGACLGSSPIGDICALLVIQPNGFTSQDLCEDPDLLNGTWLGDGSTCQQVPTLPRVGQAALVLILLAGALVILTLNGKIGFA